MKIVDDLQQSECMIVADYDRAGRIGDRLLSLTDDVAAYESACRAARALYEANYDWAVVQERMSFALIGDASS